MLSLTLGFVLLCCQQFTSATQSFDFNIEQITVDISPGVSRPKTVVNGLFPGPLIRVPYNEDVSVNVYNGIETNATTIHWHGIHQRGTPYSDGFPAQSQCPILPKTSMTYNFTADPSGSTFWHAHFKEENADGVYGPLIVEDEPGTFPYHYDEEKTILITDAYDATSWVVAAEILDVILADVSTGAPIPDAPPDQGLLCVYDESKSPATPSCSSTTDGKGFDLNFEKGKVYRLRLICSSELAPFVFSIDGHELQIVSVDYTVADGSAWVQGVPMMTGQRYDVLVRGCDSAKDGDQYWVRATMQGHCNAFSSPTLDSDVRGIVTYGTTTTSSSPPTSTPWPVINGTCTDLDYSILKPAVPNPSSEIEPAITLFVNYTFPTVIAGFPVILVDGTAYNVTDDAYPTLFHIQENPAWRPTLPEQRNLLFIPDSVRGQQVRLVLSSAPARDGGGHPFHTHGRGLKILAVGNGNVTQADLDSVTDKDVINAITRDTVVIPKDGWAITQFTAENPGVWAIHCHIGWHLAGGLVSQTVELPNAIASEITIPQVLKDMCTLPP